ncbi:MAG: hypothetical protein OER86_04775, partial [Phycisphaerae bacterium]|nr:hypothetical protein [Phycisphaerae bacterium]
MHDRWRNLVLGWWAQLVCDHPLWVLVCGAVLALAGAGVAIRDCRFEPDRNRLLSGDLPWHGRYLDYVQRFEGYDEIVVVVAVPPDVSTPADGRDRARTFVQALAGRLEADPRHFRHVWWGFDPGAVSPGLIRLLPMETFRASLQRLRALRPVLEAGNWAESFAAGFRSFDALGTQAW